MKKTVQKKHPVKKTLRVIGTAVAALFAIVVFYLAVVIGQPTPEAIMEMNPASPSQPLLQAQLPDKIYDENDIPKLLYTYPTPIMRLSLCTDIAFIEGQSYDVAYEGAFARVCEMTYQSMDGGTLHLKTIYPKRAFSLIDLKGYTLSPMLGYSLLHLNAVRMDGTNTIRFHVEGEEALYLFTMPKEYLESAPSLLKLCQLEIPLS